MPLDQRLVWTCVLADCVIDLLVSRRGSIFVLSLFFFSIMVYFSFSYPFFTASISCPSQF